MDIFIFTKKNILSTELCYEIICYYDNYNKSEIIGTNINNKNYTDNFEFISMYNQKYIKIINNELNDILNIYKKDILQDNKLSFMLDNLYHINKFNKNKDFKVLNHDFFIKEKKIYTYLKFIIFLNDSDDYIIVNNIKIKSEAGKLLLFPCGWIFPYECTKSENDNYFISGYIFIEFLN